VKVSVIIPTFQEAAGIEDMLQQTWAAGPCEVLVVDAGSPDGTARIASRCASAVYESPRSRARQQNLGAAHAQGDILLFLHADSRLPRDGITQVVSAFRDPRIEVAAFRQRIDGPETWFRLVEIGTAYRVARWGLAFGDQGICVRRETFHALGGFPEVSFLEDVLFMERVRVRSRPVLLAGPLTTSPRRWHKHGLLRQTLRNWTLLFAHQCGVSPDRLATFYPPHRTDHTNHAGCTDHADRVARGGNSP